MNNFTERYFKTRYDLDKDSPIRLAMLFGEWLCWKGWLSTGQEWTRENDIKSGTVILFMEFSYDMTH